MSSGEQLCKEDIVKILRRQRRPLSARRLLMLASDQGGDKLNYGLVLSTLKRWARDDAQGTGEARNTDHRRGAHHDLIVELRRGVFTLSSLLEPVAEPSVTAPLTTPQPSARRRGAKRSIATDTTAVHAEELDLTKVESSDESTRSTRDTVDQAQASDVTHSPTPRASKLTAKQRRRHSAHAPLPSREQRKLLTGYHGDKARFRALNRDDFTEAQRLASYLHPYPASPVKVEHVLAAERQTRGELPQKLWELLKQETRQTLSLFGYGEPLLVCVDSALAEEAVETGLNTATDDVELDKDDSGGSEAHMSEGNTEEIVAEDTSSERSDAQGYDAEDHDDDEYDAEEYDAEEYDAEEYDAEEYDTEEHDVDPPLVEGTEAESVSEVSEAQIIQRCVKALLECKRALTLEELAEQCAPELYRATPAHASLELKDMIARANERAAHRDMIPLFTFGLTGSISLTSHALTPATSALEEARKQLNARCHEALEEQLVQLISKLGADELEGLLTQLLRRDHYHDVEVLNRLEGRRLALTAQHPIHGVTLLLTHDASTLNPELISIIERRMKTLGARGGIVILLRAQAPRDTSRDKGKASESPVSVLTIYEFVAWMIRCELGVTRYHTSRLMINANWIERLCSPAQPSLAEET